MQPAQSSLTPMNQPPPLLSEFPPMNDHVFREYDLRGHAERDLTPDFVFQLGFCLAETFAPADRPPRIVIARDCRLSGERIRDDLVRGLLAAGAQVTDCGTGPTPLLYFAAHTSDCDGGIMITGSHNPAEDNGFKIMKGKGSFFGADIRALREKMQNAPSPEQAKGTREAGSLTIRDLSEEYLDALTSGIQLGPERFPFVVDAGNGAAGPLLLRACKRLGLEPLALYCEMDGRFPHHHPDPTVEKNLVDLQAEVARSKARVGLAFDGDGDRIGVVDSTGAIIWGDRLLALCARPVLAQHPGAAVLGDIKCSQVLFDDIARHGGRPIMYKTGHSLIKTKMKEERAILAGEMSGHFFFADRYLGYDDALYAALRVIEILSHTQQSPGELLSDLPQTFSTPELRVDCPDAAKFHVVQKVSQALKGEGELNTLDGVRVTWSDGAWGLVRASNTGPLLVLRFEAPSEERLSDIRAQVEGLTRTIISDTSSL